MYNDTTIKAWLLESQMEPEYVRQFHIFEKRAKFWPQGFVYLGAAKDNDTTRFIFEKLHEPPAPVDEVLVAVLDNNREVQ